MRITLLSLTVALASFTVPGVAEARHCCYSAPVYVRPVVRPVYKVHRRAYRPMFRVPWSVGLHVTGLSTNHRVGDEGVAFGGIGGHLRVRGYRWGAEMSLDVVGNRFLEGGVERVAVPLQFSGMLYLIPRGQFQLYLLGGFQAVFSHVTWDLPNLQTEQVFSQAGMQMGVGAELFISPRFALTADIRAFGLVRSDDSDDGLYYSGIDQEAVVPEKTSGIQANLGVNFYF